MRENRVERYRRGSARFWLLLPLALAAIGCPQEEPGLLPAPGQGDATVLTDILGNQSSVISIQQPTVLSMTFEFPEGLGEEGELMLNSLSSAALPKVGLIDGPKSILQKPGLYLGVQNDVGQFAHIVRLSDPLVIRSEVLEAGAIKPEVTTVGSGVIAARVPYLPDGSLKVFAIAGEEVVRIHLSASLGPAPFPEEGLHMKVPHS